MVVTAIFGLLSAVVLSSNSRFGSVIVLQNLAHDIALTVRSAQVYGIAVKRCDPNTTSACTAGNEYSSGYGMHFAPGNGYELFVDVNNNGIWDAGETVKPTTIGGGYTISSLCAPTTDCTLSRLDVTFRRPEPDACISASGATSVISDTCTSVLQRAHIVIQSPRGDTATIVVDRSGQISVQ